MKQIAILFALMILIAASSDLLKSISKFSDGGDFTQKFAKSNVSPFSESDSENYDDDEDELATNKKANEDDDGIDVMAQLKSYQQKLGVSKETIPLTSTKKQLKQVEESESEYDYEDEEEESGNMWSRGISKKLTQSESQITTPIKAAKENIQNDFNQFSSLKMPELSQQIHEEKKAEQSNDDQERSPDFESKKKAQLEKYNKKFHIDEPKESKSIYEDDSLKQFMPKINFQPLNISEKPTIPPSENKKPQVSFKQIEEVEDENISAQLNKNESKKQSVNQSFNLDAFDLFNEKKGKQKQSIAAKTQRPIESESEGEDQDNTDEEVVIVKKKKSKKQDYLEQDQEKEKMKVFEKEKEKERNAREKQAEYERKEQLKQQQLIEQQQQEELQEQQKQKEEQMKDTTEKKKQKHNKKQLSLEDFQQSLVDESPKQKGLSNSSFAQKESVETKPRVVLEEKTFTLVKDDKPVAQEQRIFKMQVIPKKQQELLQEDSESEELESESEQEENIPKPQRINCLENQYCIFSQPRELVTNWYEYWFQEFRQSFQPLIEFTFKSIGEVGSYYLSFKDHTVCLSAENLTKATNIDKVLKHFTGNQLSDYNSPIDIPAKNQPINFLLNAEYDSLLNGFSCRRFQIAIKTDLMYQLSQKNTINVKQIIFYKNRLKLKYIGLLPLNGITHQASFDQEEGGAMTNLVITSLNLPKEQSSIPHLVDKYVDSSFVTDMLHNSEEMIADLSIQTHHKDDEIGLTFNLRRRKGK